MVGAEQVRTLRESPWLSRFFVGSLLLVSAAAIAWLPLLLSTLLIGGLIFVTLVFIEPRWGLFLLPLAVPFGSIREISVGPASIGGTEALLGLFLAAWLARGVAGREIRIGRPPLWQLMALWFGVMLLSTIQSDSIADSLKELIKWGESFVLYAIATATLNRRDAAILIGMTLVAGSLEAIDGILQSLFKIGPDAFLFPLAGREWLRAYGRFTQPNPYAGYLGVVLPLGYGLLATAWAERVQRRLSGTRQLLIVAGATVATGLIALALFLTLSRGGWIGAALALLVVGILLSRRAAAATLMAVAALLTAFAFGATQFLPAALAQRSTDFLPYINIFGANVRGVRITPDNFSVLERLAHWQAAMNMWADSPWLGQGVGNYGAVYLRFNIPPWDEALGHAHNLFLNTLAETGIIGLGAYLALWGAALVLVIQSVRHTHGLWRGVAIGIVGAFVHLHAHNFFDNLYVHGIYLHLMLLLTVSVILMRQPNVPPNRGNSPSQSSGFL